MIIRAISTTLSPVLASFVTGVPDFMEEAITTWVLLCEVMLGACHTAIRGDMSRRNSLPKVVEPVPNIG